MQNSKKSICISKNTSKFKFLANVLPLSLTVFIILQGGFTNAQNQPNQPNQPLADGQTYFLGNLWRTETDQPNEGFAELWNQITIENEGKWGFTEPTYQAPPATSFNWQDANTTTPLEAAYNYSQQAGNAMRFKQHNFIWGGAVANRNFPNWLTERTADEQRAAIDRWMYGYFAKFPNTDFVDVVNEPLDGHAPAFISGNTDPNNNNILPAAYDVANGNWLRFNGTNDMIDETTTDENGVVTVTKALKKWSWVRDMFRRARAARDNFGSNAQLLINDYDILANDANTTTYIDIINSVNGGPEGTLIEGIGVQAHFGIDAVLDSCDRGNITTNIQGTIDQVSNNLNRLAAIGLPIYIAEFDVNVSDDATQRQVFEGLFEVFTSQTMVQGITLWGFERGRTWVPCTWLLDITDNGNVERESLTYLKQKFTPNFTRDNGVVVAGGTLPLAGIVEQLPINENITWASANPQLATVDQNGLVTALASTDATVDITITTPANGQATYVLFIIEQENAFAIEQQNLTLNVGETLALTTTLLRQEAEFQLDLNNISWSSSNPEFVEVDTLTGEIRAISPTPGATPITIRAFSRSTNFIADTEVSVNNPNREIDFDIDDDNNALLPTTILNNQYNDFTISTENNRRWPMLFDTSNPTSNDFDIGTPNQAYGGPGIGSGGVSNRTAQGNALVVSKNREVPNETEGSLIFDFNQNISINSIDLIDMKCGDSYIVLYNEQNQRIARLQIPAYGVNSFNNFSVNISGVRKMVINLDCGGGLTGFNYCVEDQPGIVCEADTNCEAAEFSNFFYGVDYMILRFDNPGTTTISYSEKRATDFKSIDTQVGFNLIEGLEPCTRYNVKTSIECANGKIKESEIYSFRTAGCRGNHKEGQTEELAGINLFPNPASDYLTIYYDEAEVQQITIYNTVGKTIETFNTNASGSSKLNVQQYVPGVYIMMSSGDGASFSQKFIVE